jgi:ubiquinone/menaquinone biosynthesis C-methylase UbiE
MKNRHFSSEQAAKAYARGRPYVHDMVVGRVRRFLNIKTAFSLALDVACGTGLSSIAMEGIADVICAFDVSFDMLSMGLPSRKIHYLCAAAEAIPFPENVFDFASVSSAYHWFDKKRFASELARVLKPDASAVIYETHFTGHLKGSVEFDKWYQEDFRKRYPAPARDYTFILDGFESVGIHYLGEESFDYVLPFTAQGFANHLLSMTNVTWAVEKGEETFSKAADWLVGGMNQFDVLRNEDGSPKPGEFSFAGSIRYLRKRA